MIRVFFRFSLANICRIFNVDWDDILDSLAILSKILEISFLLSSDSTFPFQVAALCKIFSACNPVWKFEVRVEIDLKKSKFRGFEIVKITVSATLNWPKENRFHVKYE